MCIPNAHAHYFFRVFLPRSTTHHHHHHHQSSNDPNLIVQIANTRTRSNYINYTLSPTHLHKLHFKIKTNTKEIGISQPCK